MANNQAAKRGRISFVNKSFQQLPVARRYCQSEVPRSRVMTIQRAPPVERPMYLLPRDRSGSTFSIFILCVETAARIERPSSGLVRLRTIDQKAVQCYVYRVAQALKNRAGLREYKRNTGNGTATGAISKRSEDTPAFLLLSLPRGSPAGSVFRAKPGHFQKNRGNGARL